MTELNISRHESVFNPSKYPYPINIVGVGATGSHVFANLVALGCTNIHVWDFDHVESHNLANQIYLAEDIGTPKVEACRAYYERKIGSPPPPSMTFNNHRVGANNPDAMTGVLFLLTDSMESRLEIHDHCVYTDLDTTLPKTFLIIETRMASTHGAVNVINPYDPSQLLHWIKGMEAIDDNDPDTVELSPCGTTLSVGATASTIANYATWQMVNFFIDPLAVSKSIEIFLKPTLTIAEAA